MSKLRILDAFCCAGGAGMGYHRAGFEVVGVDIEPQPDYPFEFVQADALEYLVANYGDFDAIHASPPCQASATLTKGTNKGREYVNLIPQTRAVLGQLAMPSVMENVPGSDLRRDLVLCGEMFGLGVIRHRYFELQNWSAEQPEHVTHRGRVSGWRHGGWFDGPYFAVYGDGGSRGTIEQWQQAMGIDWVSDRKHLAEAIPPAYTEFIGAQLMDHLTQV